MQPQPRFSGYVRHARVALSWKTLFDAYPARAFASADDFQGAFRRDQGLLGIRKMCILSASYESITFSSSQAYSNILIHPR